MMKLIIVILSAFVVATTAKNATFYTVEESIDDQYIIVMQVRETKCYPLIIRKKERMAQFIFL